MSLEILLIAVVTSLATSLIGIFLVLRRLSMLTDAISHTILLGIVIAYYFVGDLNSPYLLIGATFMGFMTVYLIEVLLKVKHINEGAAIGVVFTMLFSIAVIIINTTYRNVHLDIDMVLLGNLEFAIFDRTQIGLFNVPRSLVVMTIVLLINITMIKVFYKEIKLVSFDYALASVLGFFPLALHYIMMTLVSLTAVAAFDAVGAILVIALMVGPASTALFYTKTLFHTIIVTLGIAIINSVIGYQLSVIADVTISGMIASMTLLTFLLSFMFAPKRGFISRLFRVKNQKNDVAFATLIGHIKNHENTEDEFEELNVYTIHEHLKWSKRFLDTMTSKALKENYIEIKNDILKLTTEGKLFYDNLSFVR